MAKIRAFKAADTALPVALSLMLEAVDTSDCSCWITCHGDTPPLTTRVTNVVLALFILDKTPTFSTSLIIIDIVLLERAKYKLDIPTSFF